MGALRKTTFKERWHTEDEVDEYKKAAESLYPTTAMGGMAQNRYLKPSGNAAIVGEGALGTPTAAPASTPPNTQTGSPAQGTPTEGSGDVSNDFATQFGNFNTTYSSLEANGTINDYQKLLSDIQAYKATLTGAGNEELLKQIAELETQITGKIKGKEITQKISEFGTIYGGLEANGKVEDYQKLLSDIQLFKNTLTGEGNEEFLKQLATLEEQAKAKIEKLSQGSPMSYEDYLKNYGEDTRKNYLASVKAANDDYYRALMTYGMNAETLAGGGLTGAGVSSYGNDAAWAARQGAVSYAGAVKQAADTENAKTYFDYVQKFNASQKAETEAKTTKRYGIIDELLKSGETNAETIKMRLGMSGLFTSEEIESLGNQIASGATRVATEADVTAASEFFASCIKGGLGLKAAKLAVSRKYGDDVANTVAKNHTDVIKTEIEDLVGQYDPAKTVAKNHTDVIKTEIEDLVGQYDPAKTDQDAIAELTAYQKKGYLTPEEAEGHIATIQGKNAEYYGTLFKQARDQYDADKVLAALGIEVAEGADEATIMAEATKAAREAVIKAHDEGNVSTDEAVKMMYDDFVEEIDAAIETKEPKECIQYICNALLLWEDYSGELGNDALYRQVMESIISRIEISEPEKQSTPGYDYQHVVFRFGNDGIFADVDKNSLDKSAEGKYKISYYGGSGANVKMGENQSRMLLNIYNAWMAKHNAAGAYLGAATGITTG